MMITIINDSVPNYQLYLKISNTYLHIIIYTSVHIVYHDIIITWLNYIID